MLYSDRRLSVCICGENPQIIPHPKNVPQARDEMFQIKCPCGRRTMFGRDIEKVISRWEDRTIRLSGKEE